MGLGHGSVGVGLPNDGTVMAMEHVVYEGAVNPLLPLNIFLDPVTGQTRIDISTPLVVHQPSSVRFFADENVTLEIGGDPAGLVSFIDAWQVNAGGANISLYIRTRDNALATAQRMAFTGGGVAGQNPIYVFENFSIINSTDTAAVADIVQIGAYDLSPGHRALAIGSEETVVAETDETKFSHKLAVRINGATYNLMLCAT